MRCNWQGYFGNQIPGEHSPRAPVDLDGDAVHMRPGSESDEFVAERVGDEHGHSLHVLEEGSSAPQMDAVHALQCKREVTDQVEQSQITKRNQVT